MPDTPTVTIADESREQEFSDEAISALAALVLDMAEDEQ